MNKTKKSPPQQFMVSLDFSMSVYVPITGTTFEEAIASARTLKVPDVLPLLDAHESDLCDYSDVTVSGIHVR